MHTRTAGLLIFAFAFIMSGCGDDSTSPQVEPLSDQIVGEWECVGYFVDGVDRGITDNNVFWYFADSGEFCSQYMTAYGSYYTGSTGQVDTGAHELTEIYSNDEENKWRLSLGASADTLHAVRVAPDALFSFEWVLIQTGEGPDSSCF